MMLGVGGGVQRKKWVRGKYFGRERRRKIGVAIERWLYEIRKSKGWRIYKGRSQKNEIKWQKEKENHRNECLKGQKIEMKKRNKAIIMIIIIIKSGRIEPKKKNERLNERKYKETRELLRQGKKIKERPYKEKKKMEWKRGRYNLVLWHSNHYRLYNAKSSLYIYIKYIGFGLVGFYGILTFVGYLIANPLYTYILNIYDLVWLDFMSYHPL